MINKMKQTLIGSLLLASSLNAHDLIGLIDALDQNELVKSYDYQIKSLNSQIISTNLGYLPKIELGVSSRITQVIEPEDAFSLEPTEIAPNMSAKASWVLFDGFYKMNLSNDLSAQKEGMQYDKATLMADLSLNLTKLYFSIQNQQEDIKAQRQKMDMLKAQQTRLEKFYQSGVVTQDEVEKIKAAILSNQINIDNIKYQVDKMMLQMQIFTNQQILTLDPVTFVEPTDETFIESDEIMALKAKIRSLEAKIGQVHSEHWPKLVVMDEYIYTYFPDDYEYPSMTMGSMDIELKSPEQQNKVSFSVSMNLTDFGVTTFKADGIYQQLLALKEQLIYKKREAMSEYNLSVKYIKIAKQNIETAKQNVVANQKTFNAIDKKYKARVVDNVAYLDALSNLIAARSSLQKAKNAYQIELANYYHNKGETIKERITKETIQ
jgi:outer membrane protein TolC